jgi:ribonuclease P protein component
MKNSVRNRFLSAKKISGDGFIVYCLSRNGKLKIGFFASRSSGNAVRRNRVKRICRQWFKKFVKNGDFIVRFNPNFALRSTDEIEHALSLVRESMVNNAGSSISGN